jgi:hypothetical protein
MRITFPNNAPQVLAATITPNDDGLPGVVEARRLVGALLTFGLIAAVAGIAVSAIVWALASNSANPHMAGRGKQGVLASVLCALLIGGADAIVTFFQNAGRGI